MTLEQRLQLAIGGLSFQICALQTELEQTKAELAKLKPEPEAKKEE